MKKGRRKTATNETGKAQKKERAKARGRKLFDGKNAEIILQKLKQVFAMDGTDLEACFYAEISPSALYEYQKKHPEFLEQKRLLKQTTILKARQAVVTGLDGNPEFSLRYLERKLPDEFGVKGKEAINIVQQNLGPMGGLLNRGKNPYDDWSEEELEKEFERRRNRFRQKPVKPSGEDKEEAGGDGLGNQVSR